MEPEKKEITVGCGVVLSGCCIAIIALAVAAAVAVKLFRMIVA